MRAILGGYAGSDPAALSFHYNAFGKPHLAGGPHFNISHAEDLALLALSTAGPVGIDVESLDREMDFESVSRRYFPELVAAYPAAFFEAWTRREACLKAIGVGLSGLDRSDSADADRRCRVVTFKPAEGFIAALAIDLGVAGGPGACPPSRSGPG
jgi:4'-phosphopantetheinyl transferase